MNSNIHIPQSINFFNQIFGLCWENGYFILWEKDRKNSYSFSVNELSEVPSLLTKINSTIFFEIGLQSQRPVNNERGKEETVSAIPAFCIDIDIATPKREKKDLPQTFDAALMLLHEINLQPSITIWTGAGFQAYWILKSPLIIKNNTEMQEAKLISNTFSKKIQTIASEKHFSIDNVAALNHPMRIPGLPNYKYPNAIAIIYENSNQRYDKDKLYDWAKCNHKKPKKNITIQNNFDLNSPGALNRAVSEYQPGTIEYISAINTYILSNILNISPPIENTGSYAITEPTPDEINQLLDLPFETTPDPVVAQIFIPPVATEPEEQVISDKLQLLYQLIERCAFLKHCRDDSKTLPEPEWFFMIKILAHEPNGDIIIHELSKDYPKYTKAETDKYIQNAIKSSSGPIRCDTIKSHWDCKTNCNVTCPVHLLKNIQRELLGDNEENQLSGEIIESQVLKQRIKEIKFPENIFPDKLKTALINLANSFSVEPELIYCASLVVISSAIGTKVTVAAKKTYKTYLSLWLAIIANTGQKKTPVLSAISKILYDIQNELIINHDKEVQTYEQQLDLYNKSKQNNPTAKKPTAPKPYATTITTDPTIEALTERLNDSPNGILRLNDELKVLIDGFDKYKGKKSGEEEIYLSIFNNTPIKIDRVQKTIYVKDPFLSLLGGIQPYKLRESFTSGSFNDGFSARFLFYSKDDISRKLNRDDWTEQDKLIWSDLINTLYKSKASYEFYLGDEAWEEFNKFNFDLNILSQYSPERFKGFPIKIETYSLRFAGIIHVLKLFYEIESDDRFISQNTMQMAIDLSNYFLYQASKMFEAYSPKTSLLDKDSKTIMESILILADETNSTVIPVADINQKFNSLVDPSAVILETRLFGRYISKILKVFKIKYESKVIKNKRSLILTEKSISNIRTILAEE